MNNEQRTSLHNLPKKTYLNYIKSFPVTQSEQVRSYTTIILTLLAIIGFSVFAISPTINTILELRRQLEDNRYVNTALEEKITALGSLQAEYTGMGSTLEVIETALPTKPNVPDLFARLQTLATRYQVTLITLDSEEVELTKTAQGKEPSSFVFLITAQGAYDNIFSFSEALTDFNRVVSIDGITFTRKVGENQTVEAIIRARAYFHPEVKE